MWWEPLASSIYFSNIQSRHQESQSVSFCASRVSPIRLKSKLHVEKNSLPRDHGSVSDIAFNPCFVLCVVCSFSHAQTSERCFTQSGTEFGSAKATASLATAPAFQYFNTRDSHPDRLLLPHILWTFAQVCGTVGCVSPV